MTVHKIPVPPPDPPSLGAKALGSFFSFDFVLGMLPGLIRAQIGRFVKNPTPKDAARLFQSADVLHAAAEGIEAKLAELGFVRQ